MTNAQVIAAVLKEYVEPTVTDQVAAQVTLYRALKLTDRGASGQAVGKFARIPIKTDYNTSGTSVAPGDFMPEPGTPQLDEATVDLTRIAAVGAVDTDAIERSAGEAQAVASALTLAMEGVRDGLVNAFNRQLHTPEHGAVAKITAVPDSTGPVFTVELGDKRVFHARFLTSHLVQLATVSGTTATVQDAGAVLQVTGWDEDAQTLQLTQVSGTSTPAVNEVIIVKNEANKSLIGLDQITDNSLDLHGVSNPFWKATVQSGNGTDKVTARQFKAFVRAYERNAGRKVTNSHILVTTSGIAIDLEEELKEQTRQVNPTNEGSVKRGVSLLGMDLMEDDAGKRGAIRLIDTDQIKLYSNSKGGFQTEKQGGDSLLLLSRKLEREIWMHQSVALGVSQRAAVGELNGLDDDTDA